MGRSIPSPSGAGAKHKLGPYYLDWRADRGEWAICWYDKSGRTRRRRGTGIRGGDPLNPPEEARQALARFFLESSRPADPQQPAAAMVPELLTTWQREHVAKKSDPGRYAISIKHLLRFFAEERKAGRVTGGVTVADINGRLVERFIAFRTAEGVGGHTISRDLAALRGALNYAWKNEAITTVPFVGDVDRKAKAKPRDLVYSPEEVARLLDAAARLPERQHVFLYIMIALSTCGRSEAILDLHGDQVEDGLIRFLDRDRAQTSKRRSVVPIATTLAPWLRGVRGKVIVYRAARAEAKRAAGEGEYFERDSYDIGNAFDACLVEAGICEPVRDDDGQPVMLPPRRKLGETAHRAKLQGRGTPNTLRHTIMTEMHKRGVPEAQIEMAAGHVGEGTNKRNYRHLRPDYLAELMAAIEDYWAEVGRFTQAHLRGSGVKENRNVDG